MERQHIITTLRQVGGHRAKAATVLGIDPKTLYRKIQEYGISPDAYRGPGPAASPDLPVCWSTAALRQRIGHNARAVGGLGSSPRFVTYCFGGGSI